MKSTVILLSLLMLTLHSCAQQGVGKLTTTSSISVVKESCTFENYMGQKLVIHVKTGDQELVSNKVNFNLSKFNVLDFDTKLKIIEKLLSFKNDTMTACLPVRSYGYNGIENTCQGNPRTKRFSVQVEALYLINQLAFPNASSFYYCFPVIIDCRTNKEVNDDLQAVKSLYEIYETWYSEIKRTGKIDGDFPFNTINYKWYGGRISEPID
jgi:hypothetical protein